VIVISNSLKQLKFELCDLYPQALEDKEKQIQRFANWKISIRLPSSFMRNVTADETLELQDWIIQLIPSL